MEIKLFKLCLFLLLMVTIVQTSAQTVNRPVPSDIDGYEFSKIDTSLNLNYCLSFFKWGSATYESKTILLDPNGYVLWYDPEAALNAIDFKYDSDKKVFLYTDNLGGATAYRYIMDTNFNIIDTINQKNGVTPDIHDFILKENDNAILLGKKDSVFNLSSYTLDGIQGSANTVCACAIIQEIDLVGNLIWEWNSCDFYHPTEAYDEQYGYDSLNFDYAHINSIEEDSDGHYLVSMRHSNTVLKINYVTGAIIWNLGGKNSSFTFPNDLGFSGQHDARRLDNGRISLFDNGNMAVTPRHSRALEFDLDTINWTATLIREYDHTPRVFARAMGGNQAIGSYRVINYGVVYRPKPSVVVVSDLNVIAAEIIFKDSVMSYRTDPFVMDFEVPRPLITCFDSSGITYLKSPLATEYFWSTGENTQLIIPVIGEEYQVWTPRGVGRIGSFPFTYSGSCSPTSISQVDFRKTRSLIKTIDVLGREVNQKKSNTIYIDIFSDGSSKKYLQTYSNW